MVVSYDLSLSVCYLQFCKTGNHRLKAYAQNNLRLPADPVEGFKS